MVQDFFISLHPVSSVYQSDLFSLHFTLITTINTYENQFSRNTFVVSIPRIIFG